MTADNPELEALMPYGSARRSARPALEAEVVWLFDEFRDRLLRYVVAIGLRIPEAEEVIQETFLSLFQHLQADKPRQNLKGWLFRVGHNLALKQLAHSWRRTEVLASATAGNYDVVDPSPSPEDQAVNLQTQRRVLSVLEALPEMDRRCLLLRAEGLRYREIAAVLDISLGAVSLSLARSLARFGRATQR
ncbi:MAG TPA: sigma-70 family RNA polymerase sigma factor [Bryobacteraceae bacterium]|nr:sigma-70 family RNA polymerase sigma factor [Bryobacteraceae bacterium]